MPDEFSQRGDWSQNKSQKPFKVSGEVMRRAFCGAEPTTLIVTLTGPNNGSISMLQKSTWFNPQTRNHSLISATLMPSVRLWLLGAFSMWETKEMSIRATMTDDATMTCHKQQIKQARWLNRHGLFDSPSGYIGQLWGIGPRTSCQIFTEHIGSTAYVAGSDLQGVAGFMDGTTPMAVLSLSNRGCLVTMTLGRPVARMAYLAGQCTTAAKNVAGFERFRQANVVSKTVDGKGEAAQFYEAGHITVFNTVAFVYQGDEVIRKVQLVGSTRGTVTSAVTSSIPNVVAMVAMSEHRLAILGPSNVRMLDISPTINCKDNSFLAEGLGYLNTEYPSRAEMYLKYSTGVTVGDGTVWSFTGYRKVCAYFCSDSKWNSQPPTAQDSKTKRYSGGGFYFTKSLMCFQSCKSGAKAGRCGKNDKHGMSKCCVGKQTVVGNAPEATKTELSDAKQYLCRKTFSELTKTDGMKVF